MKACFRWVMVASVVMGMVFSAPAGEATNRSTATLAVLTNKIVQLEGEWNTAHLNNNVVAVEKLCADDLTVAMPGMPLITKTGALDAMRGGRLKFTRHETSEVLIRVPLADTAIVTGRLQRSREMGDKLVTDDLRFTKVWVYQAGQWRVTAFHASPFGP